ncbi:nucleolar protein 14 isoform X2 [Jatropha curcas]|uniref:nucleolar protein 14 isoform X2 n=1 Tax=Jatropha curcas TaxID=180498 RepID=UPI0005FBA69B|nr:nucleolar protein 14 isoform X2 [Jatropha curcas]
MAKTTKSTGGDTKTKKKNKKNKKSGPNAVAMKVKTTPKDNPFETIWSRRKFDILGKKKGKGEERRIGLARSLAIDKRKKTLLKEYEQSGKASVFIDKRIGEKNDELGEFDKAIMRSQREHQLKIGKKSKYNLSDGEEEDFDIQGLGPLSGRDDFEDEMLSDDDKDDAEADTLKQLNSYEVHNQEEQGMVEGGEKIHKTKKEVMEEVILKSKFFKAQKAKDKEENEQLMEELDKSFTSLVQSQVLFSLTEPGKMNALKALVNKSIPNEHVKNDDMLGAQKPEAFRQEQPDSYDKLVKAMALDIRAHPSDRTKTPEEIAQEERERLERLEEERQKRMFSTNDSSDEENDDIEKPSTQRPRSVSGDDLGDSFSLQEEPKPTKGWVDEILERRDADESESEDDNSSENSGSAEDEGDNEGSDEDAGDNEGSDGDDSDKENDESKNILSLKDWEQSDDDKLGTDLQDEEDEYNENLDDDTEEADVRGHKKSKKNDDVETRERDTESLVAKKIKQRSTEPDIPFLIEAPKSFQELCALLENCSNSNVITVINRIRASNAIKLAAENRKKMQVFYGLLLQYFAVLANKKPLNFELLNLLVKPLIEMSMEIPYFSAICARQRILRTRAQFCESIKTAENGCWPSMKTLSLLRLWSMIFPCSDFRHAVMTPAILLMCEYLMRCPIKLGRDIAVGSFLCSMVLSITKQSKKFCPEAIVFLQNLLMAATERKKASYQESEFYRQMELKELGPLLCMHHCVNEISPLNFFMIMDMPEDSAFFSSDNFRASVLVTVIETIRGYVDTYQELNSFPEIFSLLSELLLDVAKQEKIPAALQDKFKDVAEVIRKKTDEHYMLRRPLQMRKQKPVPIKLLNPKFEENYVKGRDYDPDRERVETRKLKKLIKREAKGAARELRKDNYFLFEVKEKDKALLEEERAEKYGRAKAFLQEQEHAFISGQLGKGRKRRR